MGKRLRIGLVLVLSPMVIYLGIVGAVTLIATDPNWTKFPQDCPQPSNCTRVADVNVRGEGLAPPRINASITDVQDAVVSWIGEDKILHEEEGFVHAKFVSLVWRFPDDLAVKLFCEDNKTVVWIHSQSRLGQSDLGVNDDRVTNLIQHLTEISFVPNHC